MSEKPSASVFKVKTFTGKWWIPGSNYHCYGTLKFDIFGEQRLKIFDYLEGKYPDGLKSYNVLHGYCQSDNRIYRVTLFNVRYTYLSGPSLGEHNVCENIIEFQYFWFGTTFYDKQEDVKFASLTFGIHNLENWQDERGVFDDNFKQMPPVAEIKMTLPADINLFEDENVVIDIGYSYRLSGFCEGQLSTSMQYCPHISIKSKNGVLPYYGEKASFEYYWYCVYEFFELLLDGKTYLFDLRGFGKSSEIMVEQKKMELLFSRTINPKQRRNVSPHQILMPYKKIKDSLCGTFSGFMNCQNDIMGILENLFTFTTTNTYHINPLPSLLFALEGLQRIFYGKFGESSSDENKADYADFENKKNTIISCCPEALHSFIKQNLGWKIPFQKRLYKMIKEYEAVFTTISDDVCEKLSKELKDKRNQSAHCDNREDTSWGVIFNLTRFVEYLHYAIILHNCGMPQETIKNCFEGCHPYNFNDIMKFISTRYAAKEETK